MEAWLTRSVALLCALGSWGLMWTFGALLTVPWHQGRLLDLNRAELQAVGIPLLAGLLVLWGTVHLFSLADRKNSPRLFALESTLILLGGLGAAFAGCSWTLARLP